MTDASTIDSTESAGSADPGAERFAFQAEVGRLLHIVAHALYSEREIFLRELISNAADACDKLRWAVLADPALAGADEGLAVTLTLDTDQRTLTIADHGIGMTRQELIDHLGTIARSGTAAFLDGIAQKLKAGDTANAAPQLIGQFGVGFYSAYMVADRVTVLSRRAGGAEAWRWDSDGAGSFTIRPVADAQSVRGTRITLHLKPDADEFLDPARLKAIVRRWSDHVGLPIRLGEEMINSAAALWTRPRGEVSDDDHTSFHTHLGGFGKPWGTLHFRAEGTIEYTGLLYLPQTKPFDLYDAARKSHLRLYVRRVFVTDEVDGLVPAWLRFLRGVIDTADLPLNVSREMLQGNPLVDKMRAGIVKRVLDLLKKRAADEPDAYAQFWEQFGPVLKEGLYEEFQQREALLGLARFRSTTQPGWVDLAGYVARMRPGQETIVYITGQDPEQLAKSPQLEAFRAKGIEVLLLTDPIDEFWVQIVGAFEGKAFKSATRGGIDLTAVTDPDGAPSPSAKAPEAAAEMDAVLALLKLTLKDVVKDVRLSQRLTDSPVCLVADDGDLDLNFERLMRQHRRLDHASKRVLEINPNHALLTGLAQAVKVHGASVGVEDVALLLLDQALILDGEPVADPVAFSRRLSTLVAKGLAA